MKIGQIVYVQGTWKGILKEINQSTYGVLVMEGLGGEKPKLLRYQKHLIKNEQRKREWSK